LQPARASNPAHMEVAMRTQAESDYLKDLALTLASEAAIEPDCTARCDLEERALSYWRAYLRRQNELFSLAARA
jgi:hypothetical protein